MFVDGVTAVSACGSGYSVVSLRSSSVPGEQSSVVVSGLQAHHLRADFPQSALSLAVVSNYPNACQLQEQPGRVGPEGFRTAMPTLLANAEKKLATEKK
jgi:hypothetical protein